MKKLELLRNKMKEKIIEKCKNAERVEFSNEISQIDLLVLQGELSIKDIRIYNQLRRYVNRKEEIKRLKGEIQEAKELLDKACFFGLDEEAKELREVIREDQEKIKNLKRKNKGTLLFLQERFSLEKIKKTVNILNEEGIIQYEFKEELAKMRKNKKGVKNPKYSFNKKECKVRLDLSSIKRG